MLLLEYGPPPSWNSSIHNSAWTAEILCIAVSWEIPQHHLRWSGFTNSSTTCDVIIVDGFGPNAVYSYVNETMKYTVSKKLLPAWNTLSQRNSCLHDIHCLKETAACMIYTVSKKQLPAWYTLSQRNSCLHDIHCLKETAACMIYTVSKKQLPAWYTLSHRNSCVHDIHCLKETAACMIYTVSKKQLHAWYTLSQRNSCLHEKRLSCAAATLCYMYVGQLSI